MNYEKLLVLLAFGTSFAALLVDFCRRMIVEGISLRDLPWMIFRAIEVAVSYVSRAPSPIIYVFSVIANIAKLLITLSEALKPPSND